LISSGVGTTRSRQIRFCRYSSVWTASGASKVSFFGSKSSSMTLPPKAHRNGNQREIESEVNAP
jgi:hypothetical protein